MVTREQALKVLRSGVGDFTIDFREGQWEALDSILNKPNARQLIVQRTGWGKSMVYFIATKFFREKKRGMTLLISPLLALMRNQKTAAEKIGLVCDTINSTNRAQWSIVESRVISGTCDFLIVAPERFTKEGFCVNVLDKIKNNIGLLVVDEAHCISDWGHDFRPAYKKIASLLRGLPTNTPVLATTATANTRVVYDIEAQLGGRVDISRGSLVRKSLFLQNISLRSQEERLAWLVEMLKNKINGSGVIYALTKCDAERIAKWLRMNGISAYAYSNGVEPPNDLDESLRYELETKVVWQKSSKKDQRDVYRMFLEDLLLENRIRVLVATSALSMGFDKSDLAFVIHYQRPKSVVDYYQQVGRAGRGVKFAYGILLNGDEDDEIANYFIKSAFPKESDVQKILTNIGESELGLTIDDLQKKINIKKSNIEKVLEFVMADAPSPVIEERAKYVATPLLLQYRLPTENIQRLTNIRKQELARMDEYVKTKTCLMNFLCSELDSPMDESSCQRCANCCPQDTLPASCDTSLVQKAAEFLNKSDLPIMPRKKWADMQTVVEAFGIEAKQTIPAELAMEEGRLLSIYRVGKLGRLVHNGKYCKGSPHFDNQLVDSSAELLERWLSPEKRPAWVACIPSLRNPTLVPDFTRRLAEKVGLPFVDCLRKVKETSPQKEKENSFFQQNNLIGAFEVIGTLPAGGCLLVDDMVDSRWSLTIAAAMLRKAGVEFVVPFALADSSTGGD